MNHIEKQKMTTELNKRMLELTKYKIIENAQEERLKNMFEHLRLLDKAIQEYADDTEILDAKVGFHQPMQVMDE